MENTTSLVGQSLGNYRLTGSLGFGAMGHVYSAEHQLMGRKAAIKVLSEQLSQNAEVVERFLNEARAVNDIRHPHVVEITDFGQVDGRYYLIMELLEGETLADYMAQCGALSATEVVRIGSQIASALDAAHRHGIVHRDLKPDNIFLIEHQDYPTFVKVLDFGVAKLMGPKHRARGRLTEVGALIGTPHYMSPEQCLGELDVGPLSDVYSLGIMLYEMACGELPFDSDNLSRLLLSHINETPPPVSSHGYELPEFLTEAIDKAIRKTPEERHPSMQAFRGALLRDPRLSGEAIDELLSMAGLSAMDATLPAEAAPPPVSRRQQPVSNARKPPPSRTQVEKARTMAATRTKIDEREDVDAQCGIAPGDEDRPQRVSHKLASIIRDRVQSQNLVLPTMPQVAVECVRLLGEESSTFSKLARTLEQDPLLAAQVLKVANSVAFVSSEKARTLEQAVSRLGGRQLRLLLIELSAHKVFQSREKRIRDAFNGIWEHSLAVALLSRALCIRCGKREDAETAHLAGLLHDLGKPMVGSMLLEAERCLSAREERFMTPGLWMQVVEDGHREVGKAIVTSWKMPDEVGIALEHCGSYDGMQPLHVRNFVTLGNALAKRAGYCLGTTDRSGVAELIEEGFTLLQLDEEDVVELVEEVGGQVGGRVSDAPAVA